MSQGMHSPRLSEHRSRGLRVAVGVVLAALVTFLGILHATPSSAKVHKVSARHRKIHKTEKKKPHKKAAHRARPGRKVSRAKRHSVAPTALLVDKQWRASERRGSARFARRNRDPGTFEIPQGDGAPLLVYAARFLGQPYRFGSDEGAFDCSGFVRRVFAEMGIDLPHSAQEQFTLGDRVSRDDLEPGDLVFFRTGRRAVGHVGIYTGDDKFVHAASHGGQVQVDSLNKEYYARHYLGARRIEI